MKRPYKAQGALLPSLLPENGAMVSRSAVKMAQSPKTRVKAEYSAVTYTDGEVVWVKYGKMGFPWPARITTKVQDPKSMLSAGDDTGILVTWFGKKQSVSFISPSAIAGRWGESNHDAHCKASKSIAFTEAVKDAIKVVKGASSLPTPVKAKRGDKSATVKEEEGEGEGASDVDMSPRKRKRSEAQMDSNARKDDDDKSDYEKLRERNMARNAALLDILDIPAIPKTPAKERTSTPVRGLGPNKRESEALPPRQRSLRIQGKDSEGQALPEGFREPMRFKPTISDREEVTQQRRTGDLAIDDVVYLDRRSAGEDGAKEDAEARIESLMERIGKLESSGGGKGKGGEKLTREEKDYRSMMEKLSISEKDVAKVVPDRIFSIFVHPDPNHLLVMAGDKWGKIGFFEPDHSETDECVTVCTVHSRPITSIVVDPAESHRLFFTSYDSIVRQLDVDSRKFVAVWDCDEDDHGSLTTCSFDHHRGQVWCGHESGMVSVMDSRAGGRRGKQEHHAMHSGKVRSVSACPSDPNLLATASHDCTVRLWDVRKLPGKAATKSGELMEWRHGKGVNFASWAPISGSHLVSTSTDDTLRILSGFKGGSGKGSPVEKVIRHDNQTGRWLTPFRAVHDPKCDTAFVVGSMGQPRTIEVFSAASGTRIKKLSHDNFSTITSLNACHPTHNVIAGGNSSGKVFVWREG